MDYDYESIDSEIKIKDKIITEIETEIKKKNSNFFKEQDSITIKEKNWKKDAKGKDIPFAAGVKTIIKEICDAKREEDENGEKIIKLSRSDVFGEDNAEKEEIAKKIIKVLMWGYPRGTMPGSGRKNIINITKDENLEKLVNLFSGIKGRGLGENEINEKLPDLKVNGVSGLGIATMSKLLYFFEVSFEGKRCLIYDSNVISFLNHDDKKLTLCEDCYGEYLILNSDLKAKLKDFIRKAPWEDTDACYFKYLGLMNDLMLQLKTDSENDSKIKEKIQGKSDKEIEEQIELYMFNKGKDLGGGEEKDNEAE
ncbi:MAG: hypothetical protein II397_03555 [Treponema sp.]|nr:hypothetical protein [Treponema sp.]